MIEIEEVFTSLDEESINVKEEEQPSKCWFGGAVPAFFRYNELLKSLTSIRSG